MRRQRKGRAAAIKRAADIKWREAVILKSGHHCYFWSEECFGRLEAHHVFGRQAHPAIRHVTDNGVALCVRHHCDEHNGETDVRSEMERREPERWARINDLRRKLESHTLRLETKIAHPIQ